MRTLQDRIDILLNHFGPARIKENIQKENLVLCKGRAYTLKHADEMKCIAKFGLNPKSYMHLDHFPFAPDHIRITKPFHMFENDESMYLQIELDDFDGVIYKEDNKRDRMMFEHNEFIFKAIGKLAGERMKRYFINNRFEEFQGVVSHSYEVMVEIGDFGNAGFCTQSVDLEKDKDFLLAVQYFAKKYCRHEVSMEALKHDLIGAISTFPTAVDLMHS